MEKEKRTREKERSRWRVITSEEKINWKMICERRRIEKPHYKDRANGAFGLEMLEKCVKGSNGLETLTACTT